MDYEQIAKLQYETQLKMREEFINEIMKHIHFQVDNSKLEDLMTDTIRNIIETSYNRGARDTIDIIIETDLALVTEDLDMEGGEDD